jgi:pentatricopeptide repeat protein
MFAFDVLQQALHQGVVLPSVIWTSMYRRCAARSNFNLALSIFRFMCESKVTPCDDDIDLVMKSVSTHFSVKLHLTRLATIMSLHHIPWTVIIIIQQHAT